ncbi:MAG TPA: SDR family oxidoreductase [Acetobacteraceae bacterium]|nr:SDR family oxidoreductase [Acetobacteraceae bacterium]
MQGAMSRATPEPSAASAATVRRVLITGAASGIGRALTETLRASGHFVITADRGGADVNADLATADGRAALLEGVVALAGGVLDGVAACAGIGTQVPAAISVNYFGAIATLQGVRPLLAASAAPRAVGIASIAAIDPVDDAVVAACLAGDEALALSLARSESFTVYSSSKAALVHWARAAAITPEWAGSRILLNLIAPGLIQTQMTHGLMQDAAMMDIVRHAIPRPLGRWGEADEVARLAAFLLSVGNSYMTGQVIFLDGGAEAVRRGPAAPLLAPSHLAFDTRGRRA